MFEEGKVYRRRAIHQVYKGQEQGGISTPSEHPVIFLFTGETGQQYGYKDGWIDENTYRYYGEGQYGDMQFVRGNRAIRDHVRNRKKLYLFQRMGEGLVRCLGEFMCVGYDHEKGLDLNGQERSAIVFRLQRVS
jgi:5-methylcytosine-specific restriction protein A